jgi:DNA-binding transcriptional LysR family regulator
MDLDQLRTFVLAAEHGGLTGAAEALNRSLPALSRRVALLEADLGVTLLERRGRRLALTTAGHELLPRARRMLDELDEAVLCLKQAGATLRRSVSLACIPSAVRLVARAIAAFGRNHPQVAVRLLDMTTSGVLDSVAQGRAELGFALADVAHPEVAFDRLIGDRFYLVVPAGHTLACCATVDWAALREEPVIGFSRRSGNRLLIERALARHGLSLHPVVEVEHMLSALDLAEAGAGLAVLPRLALPARQQRLVSIPLTAPVVTRDAGLLWRRSGTLSPAARALRFAIEQEAGSDGAAQP